MFTLHAAMKEQYKSIKVNIHLRHIKYLNQYIYIYYETAVSFLSQQQVFGGGGGISFW